MTKETFNLGNQMIILVISMIITLLKLIAFDTKSIVALNGVGTFTSYAITFVITVAFMIGVVNLIELILYAGTKLIKTIWRQVL